MASYNQNTNPLVPDYILRKLILLYGFSKEILLKTKTSDPLTGTSADEYYFINGEWINKFKEFYNYDQIVNIIEQCTINFQTYEEYKNDLGRILNILMQQKICQRGAEFPIELTNGNISFVPKSNEIQGINHMKIYFMNNFYLVNYELNQQISQIQELHVNFVNNNKYKCFISNKIFFSYLNNVEIGIINSNGMIVPVYYIKFENKNSETEIKRIINGGFENFIKMNNIDTKRFLDRFGNNEYLVNIKKYKEENNINDNPLNSYNDMNNKYPHSYINKHIKIQQIQNNDMNQPGQTQLLMKDFILNPTIEQTQLKLVDEINDQNTNNNNNGNQMINNIANNNQNNQFSFQTPQQINNINQQNQFQNNNNFNSNNNLDINNGMNINNINNNINNNVAMNSFNNNMNMANNMNTNQNMNNINDNNNININNNNMNVNINMNNMNILNNNMNIALNTEGIMNMSDMNNNNLNNGMNPNNMSNNPNMNNMNINNNIDNNNMNNLCLSPNNSQNNLGNISNNINNFQQMNLNCQQMQNLNNNMNMNMNMYNPQQQLNQQNQMINIMPQQQPQNITNSMQKQNNSNQGIDNPYSLKHFNFVPMIGLVNLGQTCYMNSVLQCFSNLYHITNYFLNPNKIQKVKDHYKLLNIKEDTLLCFAYKDLIDKLWTGPPNKPFSPIDFKKRLKKLNPLFEDNKAGDSKDFTNYLLMQLHSELNGIEPNPEAQNYPNMGDVVADPYNKEQILKVFLYDFAINNYSIISGFFYGITEGHFECQGCKMKNLSNGITTPLIKYNYENFFYLEFPLDEVRKDLARRNNMLANYQNINEVNIYDCFNYYQKLSTIVGYCEKCNRDDVQISSKNLIFSPPPILILIFNRGKGIQYHIKINFPPKLSLTNISINYKDKSYELQGVVKHFGDNSSSGHFIAYSRTAVPAFNKIWYCFNDQTVVQVNNWDDILNNGDTYILFYELNLKN